MEMIKSNKQMNETEHKRFLVVEDDVTIQPLWDRIIRAIDPHASIQWAVTEEGAENLVETRIRAHDAFDFVIADVMLAGKKTGVDLWKRYGAGPLFLFASSLSLRKFEDLVGDSENRFPYLVQKPLDTVECLESLRAMIAYKRAFSGRTGW